MNFNLKKNFSRFSLDTMLVMGIALSPQLIQLSAQTFPGQGGLVIPPGAPGQTVGITLSPAVVTGVGILGEGCTQIENVTMDVEHTWDGDIALFLIAPTGQVLELSSGNGGAGDDFQITVFTDFATQFITDGAPPYNGTFRPEGRQQNTDPPFSNAPPLGTFTFQNTFDGVNADGEWILMVNDYVAVDIGIINSWSITFTSGGGPPPEVTLGPDLTVCPGQVTTITADVDPSADTYDWNTGESTSSITVSPVVTTEYIVTVTNNGCIDTDTIEVIVDANGLAADAGPDVSICESDNTTLAGSGGGTGAIYTWSSGQTGTTIVVNPVVTTVYTLTVSEGACSSTDQVIVTVNPQPEADAGPDVEICEGESVSLEASGGVQNNDYSWSTGQSGDEITVSPFETTLYTVTVDADGCTDSDDVLVSVIEAPVVDAGPDEVICIGNDITLIATGSGGNFTWSTGQSGDEITVSPVVSTTYTVTLEDSGCESTDEVDVEVINVQADAGPNQFICEGSTLTLTATGGSSFEWSTGQTQPTISVSPSITTTYSVTVTEGNCVDVASVEIEVISAPLAMVTSDQTICIGEAVTLVAEGGLTYLWSTGQTTPEILVNPGVTTTYVVTVSDQDCFSTAETTVTVNPGPLVSAGPDQDICAGESITLTATGLNGSDQYVWNTGDTGDELTVSPLSNAIYSVTGTDALGCASIDEVLVNVFPVPTADAGPDQFIISGGTAVLTATGGNTYLWSTGETTPVISVAPTVTTTYFVTVTIGACTSTDEVTIFVDGVPIIDLGQDLMICEGESITLDAFIPGPFTLSYLWSTGETNNPITVFPTADTSFSVTVTNNQSGLSAVDTILVTVNTLPLGTPEIMGTGMLCSGQLVTYIAASVTGATDFLWSVSSNAAIISGQGTSQVEVNWTDPGSGLVQLIVSNPCGALPAVVLDQIIDGPPVAIGPIDGEMNPCETGSSQYSLPPIFNASEYQWTLSGGGIIQSGQGTNTVVIDWNNTTGGDVCVIATNSCGTSAAECLQVQTTSTPVLSAGSDAGTCGQVFTLQGTGAGLWSQVAGPGVASFALPNDPGSEVSVDVAGVYVFSYSIDQNGCVGYDEAEISFFETPQITNLTENCAGALIDYTVSFEIAGGQAPYLVNGQLVSGSGFTSGPIPAGAPYSFQVEDDNGCLSTTIIGQQECNCTTNAGVMAAEAVSACVGDKISVAFLGGEIKDADDTLAFVLHDGNLPGGIIAWSHLPEFTFQLPMIAGQTYFVSAVVGNSGLNGFPDPSDACLAFSNPAPVLFNDLPVALIDDQALIGCEPRIVMLDIGQSESGSTIQYSWTALNGGLIDGPVNGNSISAVAPGAYILAVENSVTGCKSYDTTAVVQGSLSLDTLAFTLKPPLCPGDCNGEVYVTISQEGWLFDFGDGVYTNTPEFLSACSGMSSLIVKDALGCTADTIYVLADPPGASVELGPDQTIQYGEAVELTADSDSSISAYDWSEADTCTLCSSIIVRPSGTTTYEVRVEDENGCLANDEITITVIGAKEVFIPNIFSPNGDGINDILYIAENATISNIQLFEVFDRWGNLVFRHTDFLPGALSDGWDGTYNGKMLNPGVFTCRLIARFYDDTVEHVTGDVTLIR